MYSYAGYYQIRNYGINALYPTTITDAVSSSNEVVQTERDEIMRIAADVTQAMNNHMEIDQYADYMPFSGVRKQNAKHNDNITDGGLSLTLDAPLASLTSAVLGDATSLTVDTDVITVPYGRTPAQELTILNSAAVWTQYTSNWQQAIVITGIWCQRKQYDTEGWIDSGDDVKTTDLTTTATTITVTDANGANARNYIPRFDIGQLIRIESEYMIVTGINYETTNVLTVIRGVQGTTAATHVATTDIYTFQPEPNIVRACAIITAFEYSRRGQYEMVTVQGGGTSIQVLPELWPATAMELMPAELRVGGF